MIGGIIFLICMLGFYGVVKGEPDALKAFLIRIKNSIFRNSLIFQGLPPIKYQNLMYFPLILPL